MDRLYKADRISLLSEIDELKKSMIVVKQELTNEVYSHVLSAHLPTVGYSRIIDISV